MVKNNQKMDSDITNIYLKQLADRKTECEIAMENETDPDKKLKMKNRIEYGVFDFRDI